MKRVTQQQVKYLILDKHGRIIGRSTTLTGAKRKVPFKKGKAQADIIHVDKAWGGVVPTKTAKKRMGKIQRKVSVKKRRRK